MARRLIEGSVVVLYCLLVCSNKCQAQQGMFGDEWRGTECLVEDPTGTPLNIRRTPGGEVVGSLRNGDGIVLDGSGAQWQKAISYSSGQARILGWVWSKFVDCHSERTNTRYPLYFSNRRQLLDI
jgi:hypothetical protein